MTAPPVTDAQREEFFALIKGGLSIPMASSRAGFSRQTGWRLSRGLGERYPMLHSIAERERAEAAQPAPKSWEQLSVDAQSALRDIHTFRELFFARRRQVWVYDAAMRVLEAIDEPKRSYVDINVFPGSGKTFFCLASGAG